MNVTQVRSEGPINVPVNGSAVSTTGVTTGTPIYKNPLNTVFQLIAGAAATCVIEVTADLATFQGNGTAWVTLNTLTLAAGGTTSFTDVSAWPYVRARFTANTTAANVIMAG